MTKKAKTVLVLCAILALAAAFAAGALLPGFFTANDKSVKEEGRLAGVLLTRDTLAVPAEGRLWAETDPANVDPDAPGLRFPVEGYACFLTRSGEGEPKASALTADPVFTMLHQSVNSSDDEESFHLDATVFFLPTAGVWTVNPVYQTSDGRVYAVPGESGILLSPGLEVTQDMKDERKEGGRTETTAITLRLKPETACEKLTLTQFSAAHEALQVWEGAPGDAPETLKVLPETAYVLLERDGEDGETLRELADADEGSLELSVPLPNGLCEGRTVALERGNG